MKNLTLDQLTAMGFQVALHYHGQQASEAVTKIQSQCGSIVTTSYAKEESYTGFAYVAQAGVAKLNGQIVEVNLYINEKGQNNE